VEEVVFMDDEMYRIYLLQWGHGDEAVEEARMAGTLGACSTSFNGATAMKRWKSKSLRRGDCG